MQKRELGRSGIEVSRVILGCGNFGGVGSAPAFFGQGESDREAFAIMDAAWDLGITAFDTADAYGGGRSELAIGRWVRTKSSEVRDKLVLTTKTFNPMAEGADRGLSRSRILRQIDTSLERLGLERVPLYMAHAWDPDTRLEETVLALDELVRDGKVGAVGGSNFTGRQLAEAVEISGLEGLARLEWAQNPYSLLDRDAEESVLPVCREHGLGFAPFRTSMRRLAHRQVRARARTASGIAHGDPARAVPPSRRGPRLRRARGVLRGGAGTRRLEGRARARVGAVASRRNGGGSRPQASRPPRSGSGSPCAGLEPGRAR